jgi:hypothetical protein
MTKVRAIDDECRRDWSLRVLPHIRATLTLIIIRTCSYGVKSVFRHAIV